MDFSLSLQRNIILAIRGAIRGAIRDAIELCGLLVYICECAITYIYLSLYTTYIFIIT
jgi:hypothetical protein